LREDSLEFVCCPKCHGDLGLSQEKVRENEITSGSLKCQECKREYRIEDGIPDFLLAEFLNEKDRKWMLSYDKMARSYDIIMCYLAPLSSTGLEPFQRYVWTKQLSVKKGFRILDVSTGTGRNLPFLLRQVHSNGKVIAMDISKGVLAYAKAKIERKGWKNVELQRANASYLPYKTGTFDAVIHVGGINTFGEKRRALQEIVRVAKQNAKIVIVDEGIAPEKQKTFFGKFLLRTNALYICKPPTELLPKNVKNLRVTWKIIPSWILPTSWPFYNMNFQKA
jgi:ubiquinone/menaquinone biosynthesis C-methylase UbiE